MVVESFVLEASVKATAEVASSYIEVEVKARLTVARVTENSRQKTE